MTTITTPHTPAAVRNADGLAVIGRTLHDLRGIRFDGEEGGNAPSGQQAPAGQQPAGGANPNGQPQRSAPTSPFPGPAQRGSAPAPSGDQAPAGDQTGQPNPAGNGTPAPGAQPGQQYTPEQTQEYIKQLRDEAKTNRERADAEKARADAILKAAGFQTDAEGKIVPYTPTVPTEQAQAQTASVQSERDNTQRENLVLRVSTSLKADADKMLDSRSFTDQLHALQPNDRAGAEALVREWVQKHPEHGLAPLPAAASGQTQHAGGAPVNGRKSREDALKARLQPTKQR